MSDPHERFSSPLSMASATFLEAMHEQYRDDALSVDPAWRYVFRFLDDVCQAEDAGGQGLLQAELIRRFGHLQAGLDPLELARPQDPVLLAEYVADVAGLGGDLAALRSAYQGGLAVETAHLCDFSLLKWVYERCEGPRSAPAAEALRSAYQRVVESDEFERFLMKKFPGKKKFGQEGAEAVPVVLDRLLAQAARAGVGEVVIGTMHRGRLNLMANVLGKSMARIFAEFKGGHPFETQQALAADVPYHLGHVGELEYEGKRLRVSLLPNPSHLEAVDPVTLGLARWVQDHRAERDRARVLTIILHTDAAVIGQGVVAETLQLSGVQGYTTGGVIHVVVNNQIGFTTEPHEGRASRYCTDAWKAVQSLILHVNGEDMDAALLAADMAVGYRQAHGQDAVIDLVAYRRNGHNEFDEPRFSQPQLYRHVDARQPLRDRLRARLLQACQLDEEWEAGFIAEYRHRLEQAYAGAAAQLAPQAQQVVPADAPIDTGVPCEALLECLRQLADIPAGFSIGERLLRQIQARALIEPGIAWATAEALAFGSLLEVGLPVRLAGQDVVRGAFSHRHFHLVDVEDGRRYVSLQALAKEGAVFEVINSPLSEYAALGFEYGYSLSGRQGLNIWEAQFGDFANGAQIVIDQFISSGEEKWSQRSGLTMLLPHGLEGQGPEHSSARIERYLQLCADGNVRLINPSTPANYFHALRFQALATNRKPLIVISPKTLLRLPAAVSPLDDFLPGQGFSPLLVSGPAHGARRILLCSGKIAYELEDYRAAQGEDDVLIARLEQLYPYPEEALTDLLQAHPGAQLFWVQEEPENMGAWLWYDRRLERLAARCGNPTPAFVYCGRPASASPAGSFHGRHAADQAAVVAQAFQP
ncbi:2-oxoglutarate dehydrogenase E1 component [Achromobacter denitrificans]|uniref:2-oxoglutarate dehydrogenase E1 component n=1 Tax=Achromobacter denitrificans TaxID=32002 RepID=UPI000B4DE99B|nr:2-oxoglutarate dehydrogenase E1 component [Achromobacter denitrificans]ASC66396.1 2-oxoglutarate dehydrogenase E1 component [Achromobacter denitrificans]